jgi:hypothetical protein
MSSITTYCPPRFVPSGTAVPPVDAREVSRVVRAWLAGRDLRRALARALGVGVAVALAGAIGLPLARALVDVLGPVLALPLTSIAGGLLVRLGERAACAMFDRRLPDSVSRANARVAPSRCMHDAGARTRSCSLSPS